MMTKNSRKFGLNSYIAIGAILGIICHLILRFLIPSLSSYSNIPLFIVLIAGGAPLLFGLLKRIYARDFGSDLLAGISIITAAILQEYLAGSLVILMLSGGQSLEEYAVRSASKVLEALAKRAPLTAHRKKESVIEDIPTEKITIGDLIQIFPHETCPVDGVVIEGNSVMDESYLTGEPFLIAKTQGSHVISGAINGESTLLIKANKLAVDSRYAKIMQVMSESAQKRPKIRRLSDKLGAYFTPLSILIALLAWIFSGDAIRFLAVLVIATPCPLLIGIPVAIIGSISLSASRGILIKDPIALEQLDECRTMIFDKTGTLTYGLPILSDIVVYPPFSANEVLKLVASLERYSKHPLSSAILNKAQEEGINLVLADHVSEPKGKGLQGVVDGHFIVVTSRKELERYNLGEKRSLLPKGEGLECVILVDSALAAYFRFRDMPRKEGAFFVQHLSKKHQIKKTMIVSGDREEEVRFLAQMVGIHEIYAEVPPEKKVEIVENENKKNKTIFLGDGINDAPALTLATVGIAFGQGSDITIEAARAAILESSFEKVDEFLHISKRMRKIALQSALGGMLLSLIGMIIASFGLLMPVFGAITQEVIDVLVILNSLRTIWKPRVLSDMPNTPTKS